MSFAEVQQEVFLVSCQNCHQSQGVFTFENYETVSASLALINRRVFVFGDMPPRGLAEEPKALLKAWMDQGGPP
ncbi:hypothetical protein [Bdellovibrio sp. HCB337]|uniref:hypothetical protein n=1 Tax=Bdellovibrio sp. HCB337 TaxID=3394358 RepID=UPI0039A65CB1